MGLIDYDYCPAACQVIAVSDGLAKPHEDAETVLRLSVMLPGEG